MLSLRKFQRNGFLSLFWFGLGLGFMASSAVNAESTIGLAGAQFPKPYYLSSELGLDFSPNSGFGLGLKGGAKLDPDLLLDGGVALGSGERETSLQFGLTQEIFPDHQKQPAFRIKGLIEIANTDDDNYNYVGLVPMVAKGLRIENREYHLYAGLPFRYILGDHVGKRSRLSTGLSLGGITMIPEMGDSIAAMAEFHFNIRRSHSSLTLGLSKFF